MNRRLISIENATQISAFSLTLRRLIIIWDQIKLNYDIIIPTETCHWVNWWFGLYLITILLKWTRNYERSLAVRSFVLLKLRDLLYYNKNIFWISCIIISHKCSWRSKLWTHRRHLQDRFTPRLPKILHCTWTWELKHLFLKKGFIFLLLSLVQKTCARPGSDDGNIQLFYKFLKARQRAWYLWCRRRS